MSAGIAFIAPQSELVKMAEEVVCSGGFDAKVWFGHLHEGVRAAREALTSGARVLISRGGTAKLIRQEIGPELPVDVLEIEPSVYNLVTYLHQCKTPGLKVAISIHGQFAATSSAVCTCLGIQHKVFDVITEDDFRRVSPSIQKWGASVVIGGVVSSRYNEHLEGVEFHQIDSTPESLRETFEKAALLLANLQRHLDYTKKLTAILEHSREGIIVLDNFGRVEDINRRGLSLLDLREGKPIGHPLADIIRSDELSAALDASVEAKNVVVSHNNEQLFCTCRPLDETVSGSRGTVISIQPVRQIQDMENGIRKRLHNRGFFAKYTFADIIHRSDEMRKTIAVAKEFAKSEANIVITGETGTGKELFAQSIHNASSRSNGMFVAVNCATLPTNLAESELFGYSPGAFTGASRRGKVGYFELAHNGTIFLDEITELDPLLQSRLLRVLQEREIIRVGDDKVIPVNVRVIAATNRNMRDEVADGNIRMDLFFRLNVLNIRLPPLRERTGDATHLFTHYLLSSRESHYRTAPHPNREFMEKLESYSWPGNIRQLENVVEKYRILSNITDVRESFESFLEFGIESPEHGMEEVPGTIEQSIKRAVRRAVEFENGNIVRAAKRLGISRNTLKRWMSKI